MSVKDFIVETCHRNDIKEFIETWHYSQSINGLKSEYCFKLMDGDTLIGAMIYGRVAMANVWKKYVDQQEDLIELRRLCCIDDTPKNTESYFIGQTLKYLKNHTNIKTVISYSDLEQNHRGVIYQATNFKYIGQTVKGRVIIHNGKRYHDKTIRTRYSHNGELKPYAKRLRDALECGEAHYHKTQPKNIYLYSLEDRRKKRT